MDSDTNMDDDSIICTQKPPGRMWRGNEYVQLESASNNHPKNLSQYQSENNKFNPNQLQGGIFGYSSSNNNCNFEPQVNMPMPFQYNEYASGHQDDISVNMPMPFQYNEYASGHQDDISLKLSQGIHMSYTEMMLSVESPSLSQSYLNNGSSMFDPMGSENRTFMITGRYASSQSTLVDEEEEEEEEEQPHFGDKDEEEDIEEQAEFPNEEAETDAADKFYNWQWDDNAQADNAPIGHETNNTDNINVPEDNTDKYPVAEMEMPEGVEQLTPEDIRLFLESESVEAARSGSQEAVGHHVPHLNMIFDTEDQAFKFYNDYASICGFSVKKAGNYKGKNAGDSVGTRRTYTCNKGGKVVDPDVLEERKKIKEQKRLERIGSTSDVKTRKRKANVNVITGCKAKVVVSLKEGRWHVTSVDLHHNHELCPADETRFLRSHKKMTAQERLFVRTFASVKLATRKIMAILTYLRGGKPKDVPYTKKDVSNEMTRIRQEDNSNDMMKVLEYFRKRKQEDPEFYYEFKLEGRKVLCIFWADAFSRHMYDLYGDVVSFDTTYKTNKYNLPFAPFVGITGHGHNCLFGCAIINNEQAGTFGWLFEAFKRCHGGKHPATIITDQDVGMAKAIPEAFPHTCHRNCFFHIKKKAEEKCGGSFGRIPNFHIDFSDILRNSLTVAEFESLWPEMIARYNVGNLKYLRIMWENRSKFIPVYFKTNFCPFIHSTARSEGMNAIFKDNVGLTYSAISFLGEYQKISENIEELEKEQDCVTRRTDPDYWARTELELQAGRLYNRKIFYRFQKQIMFSNKLHVDEVERFGRYEVYKTPMLQMQDIRPRRFLVSVNLTSQDFVCICGKFDKDGMVCAHILRVLVHLNMSELPEKYYIDRWKPKERKYVGDKRFNVPVDLTTSNKHMRYTVLSRRLNNVASEGSMTNRKYMFVTDEIKKIEERLDEMTLEDELADNKEGQTGDQPTAPTRQPHEDGYGDYLEDPDVAPSKCRPQSVRRQKTFMEDLFTRNTISCIHCTSHEHNIATCTNLHLPKSSFQKKPTRKKKNTTGACPSTKQTKKQSKTKDQSSTKNSKQMPSKSGCL